MRVRLEQVPTHADRSFHIAEQRLARFDAPWHQHPELELTLIAGSRGRRFVGDSIEPFAEGDLVLLGSNLPHFWHTEGHQPPGSRAHAIVVQFREDFLGAELWMRSEFAAIRRLLERTPRGLHFGGPVARRAAADLQTMPRRRGLPGLLALLDVLDRLAGERRSRPLASAAYTPTRGTAAQERMARVYAFLMAHYTEPLTLDEMARVAAMTPVAFSRYFKRASGRNVSHFLNDLRISHAAQRLRETTDSVARIATDAGYATLSSFNRRFRERLGCAPRAYRRDTDYQADTSAARFVPR